MMDFIKPHAILLSKENFYDIQTTTGAQFESLVTLLQESAQKQMPYYIVGWRDEITGYPKWCCWNQVQFIDRYQLETINDRFDHSFRKL